MNCIWSFIFVCNFVMHFEAEAEGSCSTVEKKIFDNLWNTLVALKSGSSNQVASNGKNRPAFTAALSPNPLTLSGKSAIAKFDTVILNRGGGYDSKTGKFTVPKSGIYQFSFTVFSTNGNTLHMAIVVNGKPIIYVYGAKIHGATGTASPVLELKKGDVVYLKHNSSSTEQMGGYKYSFISGYFIGE